jgi:hypothetical protein
MAPPMTVVSTGGYGNGSTVGPGGAGSYGPADTSDLEARIARLETSVQKLKGVSKLTIRRSCTIITGNPELIKDKAEREDILAGCKKVLKPDASTMGASDDVTDTQAKRFVYAVCGVALDRTREVKDQKLKGFVTDLCATAINDGVDSQAMRTAARKACKTVADDPELSGIDGAQEFLTQCRKLDASKES